MGEMFNALGFMENIAAKGIKNQVRNPGDYEDEEGLLVCGVCGEQRQKFIDFAAPTEDDPNHTKKLKVATMCRCEREVEERRKRGEAERGGYGAYPKAEEGEPHGRKAVRGNLQELQTHEI